MMVLYPHGGHSVPMLQGLVPIIPVRDMARSVEFYERLGFRYKPYEDGSIYVFLSMDGFQMHLSHFGDPEFVFNPCGVYVYVEDVEGLYVRLKLAGVKMLTAPEDKPWGLREFAVSDPDETLLRFGQHLTA